MDTPPLDTDAVRLLLGKDESEMLEFKKTLAETESALRTLSAFASQDGGTVLFGISPQRKMLGVAVGSNSLELLAQAIQAKIEPQIYPRILEHDVDARTVVSVTVRADGRVHSADGRYYARVGRTTQRLSTEELKRRLRAELTPMPSVGKHPAVRVGFFEQTRPTELLESVRLYPMWPDGLDHASTVLGVKVRTYNGGDGTARNAMLTIQFPPGVAMWSVTGYKTDMNRAIRGYRDPAIFTYRFEGLDPGVQVTAEFYFMVYPGMQSFPIAFSVTMTDEPAVSGQLVVELDQSAVSLHRGRPPS